MLYNEAGESLLRILGTGVDSVNASVIDSVRYMCNYAFINLDMIFYLINNLMNI